MISGVYIDMKNENALYTVSMLSALLEKNNGNYLDLLAPFVLHELPVNVGETISVDAITTAMREHGFKDFPHKTTEKILERLSKSTSQYSQYILCSSERNRKKFTVALPYDKTEFDGNSYEMRKKIDAILKEIQIYFQTHFYYRTLPLQEIRDKLITFFEKNGLTVIENVDDLRLLPAERDSSAFEIAHFIINAYENGNLCYQDLCDVTKGFLTCKALYYFTDEHKNSMDSKLKNVTFYLDCSLVLDALSYDTVEDEKSINELIRLVRRNGGSVQVFEHTVEEAARLIDAFADHPQNSNSFRLDGLASKKYTREMLRAISADLPRILKEYAKIDTVASPDFSDQTKYVNVLGETEIIEWLKSNRAKSRNVTYTEEERFQYDARSLISIGMLRNGSHPNYIEHAKAILVTQDLWLNKCLDVLYPEMFKSEMYYTVPDTELVSLLWLRDYKQDTTLPSDILIANAHAACHVSQEVIERAINIANSMVESGTLVLDAALLVSSHTNFKHHLAEAVRNNPDKVNEVQVRNAITTYVENLSKENIASAIAEEQQKAKEALVEQQSAFLERDAAQEREKQEKDHRIEELEDELKQTNAQLTEQRKTKDREEAENKRNQIAKIEQLSKTIANGIFKFLFALIIILDLILFAIFAVHCWREFVSENSWSPYIFIEVLSFLGIPFLFISKKTPLYNVICRVRDKIYSKVYSYLIARL